MKAEHREAIERAKLHGMTGMTSLLLRLLDDGVIEVVDEGPTALEHGYKVVATLDQVV